MNKLPSALKSSALLIEEEMTSVSDESTSRESKN